MGQQLNLSPWSIMIIINKGQPNLSPWSIMIIINKGQPNLSPWSIMIIIEKGWQPKLWSDLYTYT